MTNRGRIIILLLTSAAGLSPFSIAVVCLASNEPMENYRDLIQHAAVVDEDGRHTEEEYAQKKAVPLIAVQTRFSPTGILKCDGSELSAQLTGANNLVTTAGHGFVDTDSCKTISTPEKCTFTVKVGTNIRVSRVSGMVGTGISCPDFASTYHDWAVLTIDPPLDGITPHELPDEPEVKEYTDVISVSAMARDFVRKDPVTKKKTLPKSIEECQTKKAYGVGRTVLFESNCDLARGNSGGSLLKVVNGKDVLIGISIGNRESEAMLRKAERRGTPNTGPYVVDKWATFHVPLNSKFLNTVKTAVGNRKL